MNLIVPILLASGVIDEQDHSGMYCAIAVLWVAGLAACAAWPAAFGRMVIKGGLFVACMQLCPILQFAAGFAALTIDGRFGPQKPRLSAFLDVVFTGGFLILVSYLAGIIAISFMGWMEEPSKASPNASDGL